MTRILAAFAALSVLVAALGSGIAAAAPAGDDELTVLVFSRTTIFRHDSIPAGIATIEELGADHGFEVVATEETDVFTPEGLAPFDAVVFLNTTGEVMPDDAARDAFEDYVRGGGAWVGVHSAADTEYEWPFYESLLGGAYFSTHPLINQPGTLDIEAHDHPSVAHLPERWSIPQEEYYSFRENPRDRVRVLMTIDESSYLQVPNTAIFGGTFSDSDVSPLETGIMGDHPMSWCQDVDAGRAWYTALGHEAALYGREDFREHLLQGILTAAGVVAADCRVGAAAAPDEPSDDAGADPGDDLDADGEAEPTPGPEAVVDDPPADDPEPAATPLPATGGGPLPLVGLLVLAVAATVTRRPGRAAA